MNAAELIRRIEDYGGDMPGIRDRFMGNEALFQSCFEDFMAMPNFDMLRGAIQRRDYDAAFKAAHAIKGVAGNVGVTPFYKAVCALVEVLRAKAYEHAAKAYERVEIEYEILRELASGGEPPQSAPASGDQARGQGGSAPLRGPERSPDVPLNPPSPPLPPPSSPPSSRPSLRRRKDRYVFYALLAVATVAVTVCVMFGGLIKRYNDNAALESATHLSEISHQLRLYTEAKVESDWVSLHSIVNSITSSDLDEDALLQFIKRERGIRNVTDIAVYMEDGSSVCTDGHVDPVDESAEFILATRQSGARVSILDSNVTYAVPVLTDRRYGGARVAVVSVRQNMDTFLDSMNFESFGGAAYLYLTQENGVVISKLTHPAAPSVYNIMALLTELSPKPLLSETGTEDDLLHSREPAVFTIETARGTEYVISTPVTSRRVGARLFYIAPESVVNQTTQSFSRYVVVLIVTAITVFALGAAALFVTIYRSRRRQFDTELKTRDRMLDLLVKYSQTAFGLFSTERNEPLFISSNARPVMGVDYLSVERDGDRYRVRAGGGAYEATARLINERMALWDGRGVFRSGFIPNADSPTPAYFELTVFPIADDLTQFVAMAQDVTQTYERDSALREALEMAQQANTAKSRFLSNMSHDIRTPMNAIINMTRFARESLDDTRKADGYLHTVEQSAQRLLQLINDVLDMSRIESGRTVLESKPFDLREELTRVSDTIRPLCAQREQLLITDFSALTAEIVVGDSLKLSQVLINLLSNAVKFTPQRGAVRFAAQSIPSLGEGTTSVRFVVEDTGIGIAKDDIPRLFEPFMRVDDKRVNRIEGTGLGLSICKSYVTAMGGTIACTSEENEGSVFTVELSFPKADFVPPDKPEPVGADATPFTGMRCLLCEDNPTNQVIARAMMERAGFAVELADDGAEGLARFSTSAPGYYDVIYMDIQMPILDGYEATVAIRACAHPQAGTIPIIAITANVFAEDVENARIAGMDGHLDKPISMLALIEETSRAMEKKREESI